MPTPTKRPNPNSHLLFKLAILLTTTIGLFSCQSASRSKKVEQPSSNPLAHRVIVSSDIGGTDPDDFQSMVHLLLYADTLDIEGLISSPYGPGHKKHILQVIDQYEKDYPSLRSYSDNYPPADSLRAITKQGETAIVGYRGYGEPSEGSNWLIDCARRPDPRPLYVLVWGGLEDVAQALHDAPDILPKLRVYWIGGPNKKWSPDAYQYLVDHHPNLWIIESNASYRGWFNGGIQDDEWSNNGFPHYHIAGRGAMADFFMNQLGGTIKMGDTPSVAWLLSSDNPEDPSTACWGGQYIRAWKRPHYHFTGMPTARDSMEEFCIMELVLPLKPGRTSSDSAFLKVDNQALTGYFLQDDSVRFRFSPKSAKQFDFTIESTLAEIDGKSGSVQVYVPAASLAQTPSKALPNWWTDDPDRTKAEGEHIGAKTVSQWRLEFLTDFAKRMQRCSVPKQAK